jgi:hypothetical protein
VTAYKNANGGDEVFKIAKDYTAKISSIDYVGGKVMGLVDIDGTIKGWIDLSGTYFVLKVAPKAEINIFTTTDKEAYLYDSADETVKITRPAGVILTVRSLTYVSNGNVWAMIVQTDDVVNDNWVIIRNGDGTMNVNYA